MRHCLMIGMLIGLGCHVAAGLAADGPLIHFGMKGDLKNAVTSGPEAINHGVALDGQDSTGKYANFDGQHSYAEIPAAAMPRLGTQDFTISVRVRTGAILDDDLGDILSQFDAQKRTGFQLSIRNNAGITHSQSNYRQVQFGIDAGTEPIFVDEGRPGSAIYGQSIAVNNMQLYVGTCVAGADQSGHVFQYNGPNNWIDLGSPDKCNSVTAMAELDGILYVGTGKYRLGGSALSESENPNLGGRIFRHWGKGKWTQVGHFPEMEAVGGMVVFRGKMFVSSLYKPAEFYRYETEDRWTKMPVPNGKRVEALTVYDSYLWASGYDEGHVYRFDGENWTDMGQVGDDTTTQTYAFATYRGKLRVATWRSGKVYEWANDHWEDIGQLGEELEVMGMLNHNGSFYGGTLPLGQIYRWDGDKKWTMLKQLDTTPDVKYRRVWTMAQFRGKLFATTLPSGNVWSMQTGACVTWDQQLPAGWHHIAAQRQGDTLRLFVDGVSASETKVENAASFDLSNDAPWQIGAGTGDYFKGGMAELRFYQRALSAGEIQKLSKTR